jgi:hypothetical protein
MRILAILLSLSFSLTISAQDYGFGKVSKEELQEKFNPLDSSANATYLYKNRRTYFVYRQEEGFSLVTDVQERIKIYNQEGFDKATKAILLYDYAGDSEKISGFKAYTYNLIDGKIEEDKLKNDGIFKTKYNEYYEQTKFTMPNIKEGSVIEYKYSIESPFYWNVDEFVFQHDIPVKKLEAYFEAPEYFNFKSNTKGFLSVVPKNETKNDKITFNYKERNTSMGGGTTFSSSDLDFVKYVSSYDLSNIPALKEEPYVNNIDNYRSAVKYELSYTKFPQAPLKYFSTTWEDVVKTIYESPNFGGELDKTGYYDDEVDALIVSVSDPLSRTGLIFNFVKSQVKWNGYNGKYTNDGVRKAFKDHVGNVAEINLMLTSMLRYAGLNAYPVLVSTRDNGIPLFPTRDGYNYVITYVKFPQGGMLLDATNKFSMPNILPFRALNWQGRIITEHGNSELIDLYPKIDSKDQITMMVDLHENGDIEGGFRSIKTNHDAMLFRQRYNDVDQADFLEKLENKYDGLEVSEFKVANTDELSKPIMESYKLFEESQADIIGDKIYFSPLFHLKTTVNPFKLEKREFPVDFGYPSSSIYRVSVNLPEGYQVETMPEPKIIALPDDLGSFKYIIASQKTSIQLTVEYKINQAIILPFYYETLKEYFKQLIEKENEQIVLTKTL